MKKISSDKPKNIDLLEEKIGVGFIDKNLLWEALTHRSYINENHSWPHAHNERLEFLGDAVLELAISVLLYRKFPKSPEGDMTMLRAALVNFQRLALVAKEINLNKFILMSKGEAKDTGRAHEVILANAIESLIGAIYLDQGFKAVHSFIEKFVFSHLDEVLATKSYKDPKSELQEMAQEKLKVTPTYKVKSESGPAHEKTFLVGVYFDDKFIAEGSGQSKQEAEIEAARSALANYQDL